jgi:DNA polymerase III, beta subunit|nr:MAG TPA: beta clamp protein [Caudoviricetes sp.]
MEDKLKATVKTWKLLEAVKIAENFAQKKKLGKEYLKGVFIETDEKKNVLVLRASDSEKSVRIEIAGEITGGGKALVPCKIFKDLVKGISSNDVTIAVEKDKIIVQTNDSKGEISLIIGDLFPDFESVKAPGYYSFLKENLKNLFDNVMFSASANVENFAVNCVRLDLDGEYLKAIGTDTYRLAYARVQLNPGPKQTEDFGVSIPMETVKGLLKVMKSKLGSPDEMTAVSIGKNEISFKFVGIEVVSELVDLGFPDYKTIISGLDKDRTTIVLSTKNFISTLKRAYSLAKNSLEYRNGARFNFAQNKLLIKSNNGHSEFKEELATIQTGDDLKIALNVKFLLDFIKKIKDKTVVMKMLNNKSTVLVKGGAGDDWFYLMMPLALRD